MWRKSFLALALVAVCACAPAYAQDAKGVLGNVAQAMGASTVKTIQYSGNGFIYTFGQSYRPTDPWPKFILKSYSRSLDLENGASEEKAVWTPVEERERGGGFVPLKGDLNSDGFVSGDAAWNVGANGPAPAPAIVEERQVRLAITPLGFLKAAMTANPTITSKKGVIIISFTVKGKYKVNGYVNGQNLLDKVETWIPQPILGDMPVEVTYSNYRDYSGVKFPGTIQQKEGGFPVLDLAVTAVTPNAPLNIQVPPAAKAAVVQPLKAESQQLGEGVWIIRAGVQSVAVEFKDFLAIVDGAANEERSLAVIAEAKRLAPNKPVKYVIATHHHLDHAGGLRTFVAEGSTIVGGEGAKPFYEKIFKLPFTMVPDKLARSPRAATFVTVKDKYVITDGSQSIELYSVPGNNHAPDEIIAYMPKIKTIAEADLFNPAPAPRPDAPIANVVLVGEKENLRDNIQRLKLDVQNFVAMHANGPTPFAELQKQIDIEHDSLQRFEKENTTKSSAIR